MKKLKLLFAAALSVLLVSCASNGFDPATLESETFQVTEIQLAWTDKDNCTKEELYKALDFEKIEAEFLTKYGYALKHDNFTEADIAGFESVNIDGTVYALFGDNTKGYLYKMAKNPSDSKQKVTLTFAVPKIDGIGLYRVDTTLPNGKSFNFQIEDNSFASKHIIADKDNAAIIKFKDGVIVHRINGENASAYCKENRVDPESKEYTFYFPAGEDVEFFYSIYQSGNAFVAGGYWPHQTENFKFEKGKKYLVSYEIDRSYFLQSDWKAALKIEEIK